MTKRRITFFSLAAYTILFGSAFGQEPEKQAKALALVADFSNLPEEERKAYGEHKGKAQQFLRQKRVFEALDQIHQALTIFDNDPSLWNMKGSCHVEFRSFVKGREAFQRSLALDERSTGVMFNLAEMDFVTKEWNGCISKMSAVAEKLEENHPEEMPASVTSLHRLALFKVMLSHLKLKQQDKALAIAEENWEDWDDTPFTYYSKAALAYHEGDKEKATSWVSSAIRVFGGLGAVANWQDTLIEFGYVKSFYGGDDEE